MGWVEPKVRPNLLVYSFAQSNGTAPPQTRFVSPIIYLNEPTLLTITNALRAIGPARPRL
jgi:hypothetical protein